MIEEEESPPPSQTGEIIAAENCNNLSTAEGINLSTETTSEEIPAGFQEFKSIHPELFPDEEPLDKQYQIYSVITGKELKEKLEKDVAHKKRLEKLDDFKCDESKDCREIYNTEIKAKVELFFTHYHEGKGGLELDAGKPGKCALVIFKAMNTLSFNNLIYFYDHTIGVYREDRGQVRAAVRVLCGLIHNYDIHNKLVLDVENQLLSYNVHTEYPFNKRRNLIPIKNGTLHLISDVQKGWTFELKPMSDTDLTTWRIPLDYDEKKRSHCQKVTNVFKQWVDEESVPSLIRAPAQAIRQASLELPFKRSYLCIGPKDAGKSTYLSLLFKMFDGLYSQIPLQEIGTRFTTAEMEGMLLNVKDEISDRDMKNLSEFKDFAGASRHRIERKGKQAYTGRIYCGHIFACNTPPKIANPNDIPTLSRFEILIFPNSFDRLPGWVEETITEDFKKAFLLLIIDEVANLSMLDYRK